MRGAEEMLGVDQLARVLADLGRDVVGDVGAGDVGAERTVDRQAVRGEAGEEDVADVEVLEVPVDAELLDRIALDLGDGHLEMDLILAFDGEEIDRRCSSVWWRPG